MFASRYHRTGSEGTQNFDPDTGTITALHLVNVRTGFKTGPWDCSLNVKNLLGDRTEIARVHSYAHSAVDGNPSQSCYGTAPAPRMIGVAGNYKF